MAQISWLRYPVVVHLGIRTIPVEITLQAGLTPADVEVRADASSAGVSIYQEPVAGVLTNYSEVISVPLNQYRMFIQSDRILDRTWFVASQVDPLAQDKLAVTLGIIAASGGGPNSDRIYVDVSPTKAETITTIHDKDGFSDDFSYSNLLRDRWTPMGFGIPAAIYPAYSVATSQLTLSNPGVGGLPLGYADTIIISDIIEGGRCHAEFRGVHESSRIADAAFLFGIQFLDGAEAGVIQFTTDPNTGLSIPSSGGGWAVVAMDGGGLFGGTDLASTIRFITAGENNDQSAAVAIVLPSGQLTTGTHDYVLDFDGHSISLTIDGVLAAVNQSHIPLPSTNKFFVSLQARQLFTSIGTNSLRFERIDINAEERLMTASALGAGASSASAQISAPEQSKLYPDPASIAGAARLGKMDRLGNLKVRGAVLTDEGSFSDDFGSEAVSLSRALTGTSQFTNGSTGVVGTSSLYTTQVRVGDYVQLNADNSLAAPKWAQVASIQDNTHLTLVAAYTGAGGAAGASSVSNYVSQVVGAGASISVLNSVVSLAPGVAAGSFVAISRALSAGSRKGYLPFQVSGYLALDNRRADQIFVLGVADSATLIGSGAWFTLNGTNNTAVIADSQTSAAGADILLTTSYLPNGGISSAYHYVRLRFYQDRCAFYLDNVLVAVHQWHLVDPYAPLSLVVYALNTGVPAGASILTLDAWHLDNFDSLEVRSPELEELAAKTPLLAFGPTAARAGTAIADNNVHEITNAAGAGMQLGHRYLVSQIGGQDIQVVEAAAAPAVATVRMSPAHLMTGIPWEFSPTAAGMRLWAVKATDGTANATTYCASTDGGTGA